MVRSILDGRKSQTRRIVKYPKQYKLNELLEWEIKPHKDSPGLYSFWYDTNYTLPAFKCPYGIPSDILWVRETFLIEESINAQIHYEYKADYSKTMADDVCWKPSIFMPKEASRLKLKVTNIRVERLQDITEEDAIAEGIEKIEGKVIGYPFGVSFNYSNGKGNYSTPKEAYMALWEKINGKDSWKSNPWVWVIEFEKL